MKTNRWRFSLILGLCVLVGVAGSKIFGAKRPAAPTAVNAAAPVARAAETASSAAAGATQSTARGNASASSASPTAAAPANGSPVAATDVPAPMNPNFRLRPFAVVKSSATHQWTAEDGRTNAAIHELAHNALEEERYEKENQWTVRRQLVYRNEKVGDFVGELESGARQHFIVPGFDGAEFVVNVQNVARCNGDGFAVQGELDGFPGSRFQMGYAGGREAMTIEIPSRGLRYEIGPRENNEVVVSEIDVAAFQRHQPPMGEPRRNDDVGRPGLSPRR